MKNLGTKRNLTALTAVFVVLAAMLVTVQMYLSSSRQRVPETETKAAEPYIGGSPPGGSANVFLSQLKGKSHPYLLFDQSQLTQLRNRRSQVPYNAIYSNNLKSWADDVVKVGVRKSGKDGSSGWIMGRAVRTGLVYLVEDDPRYLTPLQSFINSITTAEEDKMLSDYQTVHQVLPDYALLYDFTASSLTASEKTTLENLLVRMVNRYIENFDGWNMRSYGRFPTNHATRGESAVCLTAMVYPQHASAVNWIDRCLKQLYFQFSHIAGNEGPWVEGPSYFNYGIGPFFTFGLAYNNLTGKNLFSLTDPPVHQLFDAMIKIRRPDGYGPQFNDATTSHVNQQTIAWLFPDKAYHHWSNEFPKIHATPGSEDSMNSLLDFIFYQPVTSTMPPWGKTTFFPKDQAAVFRKDFSDTSSYVFLRGYDLPVSNHEHPNQGNFEFWAYKTPLMVEPGYTGWDSSRNEYLTALVYPEAHNLVLVDGTGPYKKGTGHIADTFGLTGYADTSYLDTADLEGNYDLTGSMPDGWLSDCQDIITGVACNAVRPSDTLTDVDVARSFAYIKQFGTNNDKEYLVVFDDIKSTADPVRLHDYSFLLHGPSEQFSRSGDTYTWSVNNPDNETIVLKGITVSNSALNYATRKWYHVFPFNYNILPHTRLSINVNNSNRAVFGTVLFPYKITETPPTLVKKSGTNGSLGIEMTLNNKRDLLIINPNATRVMLDTVETDAWFTFIRFTNNSLDKATIKQGSFLSVGGRGLVQSPQKLGYHIGEMVNGSFVVRASSGGGVVPTPTPTLTPTPTRTPAPTRTPTPTRTPSPTRTPTPTTPPIGGGPTVTRTATPTRTPTPSSTRTPSPTRTLTPTPSPSSGPSASPTPSRTPTPPSVAASPTPLPTWTTGEKYQLLVGDVNDDNAITIEDVSAVLAKYTDFSVPIPPNTPEDVNADGAITIEDVALVLLNYVDFSIPGDEF